MVPPGWNWGKEVMKLEEVKMRDTMFFLEEAIDKDGGGSMTATAVNALSASRSSGRAACR